MGSSCKNCASLLHRGKIEDDTKMANVCIIPEKVEYPDDGRIKTGKYINWKNTNKEEY